MHSESKRVDHQRYELTVSAVFEVGTEPFAGTYRMIVKAPHVIEPEATPEGVTPVA